MDTNDATTAQTRNLDRRHVRLRWALDQSRRDLVEPFSTHVLATFPDLDVNKIRRLQNQYWNAFKHAMTRGGLERDDRELLERFDDKVNDHRKPMPGRLYFRRHCVG